MKLLRITIVLLLALFSYNTVHIFSVSQRSLVADIPSDTFPIDEKEARQIDSLLSIYLRQIRFNGNVAVVYKGVPIYHFSNGYRHLTTKEKIDRTTVFQLASVSKAFTAMAVMILHQKGQLNINQPVGDYLPGFPWPEVRIIHLLQHTAGLPNYMYYIDNQWPKDKPLTYDDVLKSLKSSEAQLRFKPGSRFDYSNTGYVLLAMIVEKVSAQPFHVFLRQHIFEPLQMNQTFAWNKKTLDTTVNLATGFKRSRKGYYSVAHDPLDEISGDKSIYSTIDDLVKWEKAWTTNILIHDSLIERAYNQTVIVKDKTHEYGFGWRIVRSDTLYRIFHNGLWNGFTTAYHRFMNDSITIIVLSNTNTLPANTVNNLYHLVKSVLNHHQQTSTKNFTSRVFNTSRIKKALTTIQT